MLTVTLGGVVWNPIYCRQPHVIDLNSQGGGDDGWGGGDV